MELKKSTWVPCVICSMWIWGIAVAIAGGDCAARFDELNEQYTRLAATLPSPTAGGDVRELTVLETQLFQAFEQCPESARLFTLMGEVQLSRGQVPLAIAYAKKAVTLDGDYWRAHQLYATALALSGQVDRALHPMERAMKLAPANARVRFNYASVLFENRHYDQALAIVEELVKSRDLEISGAAYNLRGRIFVHLGRIDEAGDDFNRAKKLGVEVQRHIINKSDRGKSTQATPHDSRQ